MKISNNPPPITKDMLPPDHPLRKAAEGMEANFMKELIRNMRNTVGENEDDKNNKGLQLFRGMLDDEYAEKSAQTNGGLGLSNLIIRQVQEMMQAQQHGRQQVVVREMNQNDLLKK